VTRIRDKEATRIKLLEAARDTIRLKGYSATTVDDVCEAAGVTKGSFFHHFNSKENLGIAAAEQFGAMAETIFSSAPYHAYPDPRDRLLGYVDFRAAMLQGDITLYTCLLGTMVQEIYATHPQLRAACDRQMSAHIADLVLDVEAAKQRYAPNAKWSAESVGYFMQAVLQGAFVYSKAKQSPQVAIECLAHLRVYLETLFTQKEKKR
jgi:TetR/AcrR family transcriptional repressor of nem operon